MKKDWIIIVLLVLIIIGLIGFYINNADFTPKSSNEELINRINKLELKIDSINNLKDSIRTVIDSTHVKIITNEKHYQERINTITYQSYSEDSNFVTDYIRQYSDKNSLCNFD